MKFGQYLHDHRVIAWRPYYMNYHRLKAILKDIVNNNSGNERFLEELKLDMVRVEEFYTIQEQEAAREAKSVDPNNKDDYSAFVERVRDLENFAKLNAEGLRKIAKKYDKLVVRPGLLGTIEEGRGDASLMKDILREIQHCTFSQAADRLAAILDYSTSQDKAIGIPLDINRLASSHVRSASGVKVGDFVERFTAEEEEEKPHEKENRVKFLLRYFKAIVFFAMVYVGCIVCWVLKVGSPLLDGNSFISVAVTCSALALLIMQYPADGVMMGSTLVLTLAGVLDNKEAWDGFSNDVVLSVGVLLIVSAAVKNTGVVQYIFIDGGLLGHPKSLPIAMLRLFVPAVLLNVCVSNTAVMGVLLPVVQKWSKDIGLDQGLLLMPMSYILLISGVFAIFSTSSNLITQGLLVDANYERFDNFALAPLILPATIGAFLYIVIAVPLVFKDRMPKARAALANGLAGSDRRLLPKQESLLSSKKFVVSAQVTGLSLDGKTLADSGLYDLLDCNEGIVEIERLGEKGRASPDFVLQPYDVLHIYCSADTVLKLQHDGRVGLLTRDSGELSTGGNFGGKAQNTELFEVVLDGLCPLIGQPIVNAKTRKLYGGQIVAIRPHDLQLLQKDNNRQVVVSKRRMKNLTPRARSVSHIRSRPSARTFSESELAPNVPYLSIGASIPGRAVTYTPLPGSEMEPEEESVVRLLQSEMDERSWRLAVGDGLIVEAPSGFAEQFSGTGHFAVITRLSSSGETKEGEVTADGRRLMWISGVIVLGMVLLVATNTLPLLQASMTASLLLVLFDCLSLTKAVGAVNIRTVMTIVGAFGVGKAMAKTHVATILAQALVGLMSPLGALGVLGAIFVATCLLGVVFHATAVVVLLFPVCVSVAHQMGLPVHQCLGPLMVGAGCQFLSPISYQTNLMVYAVAGYAFGDFAKLGLGLTLVVGIITVPLCRVCL
ncbi:sodium/sulfate transporter, putative [Perkinsus marinus ATCC 50983]|uniref:Sodium/sulfate transporter, putative n=1 Tax=Perkinsus marinus (strain ATCC 50983 / TXsc) TaxID=423536 RepID=C5LCQ2_PERM5|nr:sodium/sulfate transporter, putative [Perkinsus marinus ATCC 50983]EER05735.1 sodium/sulfate transporter, putative [Perkinsus marinus ATCC 50983]|eukprot:XP_002773919.1 sodium/sulfate transporter, putative [Perkinsus marinus ATCC 50983]